MQRRTWIAVASSTAAVALSAGVAPAQTVTYDFDNGTLQGWTNTRTSSTSENSSFVLYQNTFEPNSPVAQSGSGQVAPQVSTFNCCPQDSPHDTLVLTSPQFTLDNTGSITFYLTGGEGAAATPGADFSSLPASSSEAGFQGVALRNVTTGAYVLSERRAGNDNVYQLRDFTNAELAGAGVLGNNTPLVLDLIDTRNGGWGWLAMDTVTVNGVVPEPASFGLLALAGTALLGRRRRNR